MIKINLKEALSSKERIELYNEINRIPFSITIGEYNSIPTTIYSRNFCDENFIEFRFDKQNLKLYEISLVSIQKKSMTESSLLEMNISNEKFYSCLIDEKATDLEISLPMKIFKNESSVCISWDNSNHLNYYKLTHSCFIGVNNNSCLSAVFLKNLNIGDIENILG